MSSFFAKIKTILIILAVIIAVWHYGVSLFEIPKFLLPKPSEVLNSFITKFDYILNDALVTLTEIVLGLFIGIIFGITTGLLLQYYSTVRKWFMPILIMSQAIPVYAFAPLLVLWFGYDMAPKVIMTVIIIFFPITSNFYDGLRNTDAELIDLAKSYKATDLQILFKVRLPASVPSLGSGIKIAATLAPIGAVVGEWVGASAGLGYRMVYANSRMQTQDMFSALIVLLVISITLYYTVDRIFKLIYYWKSA